MSKIEKEKNKKQNTVKKQKMLSKRSIYFPVENSKKHKCVYVHSKNFKWAVYKYKKSLP